MNLLFRQATEEDLAELIDMLADDALGRQREAPGLPIDPRYLDAFCRIDQDSANELIVVLHDDRLVGMLQLTFIPYLTHTGSIRCLIDGVRIHKEFRGHGLGGRMFEWAIAEAKKRGCTLVQLTSDKSRPDAIRFYEKLGFVASHEGLKLKLEAH